jgi:hypothetical protein
VEQQPTREELAAARERGRADAEERARAGGADDVPGTTNPLPYAPESLQAAYEDAYDARLAELDRLGA